MRVLFDTNVVLDVLLDREPHSEAASTLFSRVETGALAGYLCATTVTTVHYLAAKAIGPERSVEEVQKLLNLFETAPVNRSVLEAALEAGFSDFEDAVLYESARHVDAEAIVTRNVQDFKQARIAIYSSDELVHVLNAR